MTPDNPYAVAYAFWYAAIHDDYKSLDRLVTPESREAWNLTEISAKTENGGITTGVHKPCYDVAYMRLLTDVDDEGDGPLVVAGGLMPAEARVISLVLRTELGGWRVHGFGYPMFRTICRGRGLRSRTETPAK